MPLFLNLPPPYNEALIALIDALRGYIESYTAIFEDMRDEDAITHEDYDDALGHLAPMRELLKQLEDHEIDPSLHGKVLRIL